MESCQFPIHTYFKYIYTNNKYTIWNTLYKYQSSFGDNGIKIGKGVSKIKIDGILNIAETKANSNKGFCIYKNNSLVVQSTLGDVGTRSYSQNVMMGQILDVAENDIIQIYVRAIAISSDTNITINGNSGGAATYMTAEVLA